MIEFTQYGDVQRLRMWTLRSRAVGYDSSAYFVRGVLIDTGPFHVRGGLGRALRELRPRGVVVTHWHEDHAGNAAMVAANGFPMWMHEYTERQLRAFPRVKFYRHFTWGRPGNLRGDVARFDPAPLQVIATPGHSPDHHAVWDAETRTLFSADLWLGVKVRAVAASERPRQIIASLTRAIELDPVRVFDAHRGLVDRPVPALEAKRAWLEETIGAVERALAAGDSEDHILRAVLGGEESTGFFSEGEYSRRNFVKAVMAEIQGAP
ncbi:MAG: MBL fold metallo-hydrolase [Gemmatimonadota bacterium]